MEENNKNSKGLIVLVIILIICILGLGGYIVYDKMLNKETKTTDNTKSSTTKPINNESEYDKTTSYDITLNNNNHKIYYKYKIVAGNDNYEDIQLAKENGDYIYNELHAEIYLDNSKINDIVIYYDKENNINNVKSEKENLDLSKTKIIKGKDNKDYLIFTLEEPHQFLDGRKILFISNDDGNLIYKYEPEFNSSLTVNDSNSKFYNSSERYIIETNKIYIIEDVGNNENGTIKIQENILTIENNEVNIEKGNIYEGSGAGAR